MDVNDNEADFEPLPADFEPQESSPINSASEISPNSAPSEMEDFIFGVHPFDLMAFALVLVILCSVFYIVQSGLFAKIEVKTVEPKDGSMVVAYKSARGPYKGAGEIFTDIYSIMMNPDRDQIGIYYDDPDAVAANDLRYAVGVILASGTEVPDPAELEAVTKQGYKIVHFPKPNYVVLAEFPFKNTLSIYMGIFRVYPKLKEYIAIHGLCAYPALEIYSATKIKFMMPLSKQEDFFVPEFCEEQVSIATTEFSNHPDQAAADEELKHKNHEEESKHKNESEGVFAKPATPPPITPKVENTDEKNDTINENSEIITEDEEDSNSDFEKVEPEN